MESTIKHHINLAKPGIIFGNALTALGGFGLAHTLNLTTLSLMLAGLSLIIGSGCSFNNYIDRELDGKMTRTKNRPLVTQALQPKTALYQGALLATLGTLTLLLINPLTTCLALIGLIVYIFPYSFGKYRTSYGTLIGSIAGALPPVIGYTAVTNTLDLNALFLFLLIATWQMPHFYAIALYRHEDYRVAAIPTLPVRYGVAYTKAQMLFYTAAFALTCYTFPAGPLFHYTATILGATWVALCLKGYTKTDTTKWARAMFLFSLITVTLLSLLLLT